MRFAAHSSEHGRLLPIDLSGLPMPALRIFTVNAGPSRIRGGHGPLRGSQLLILVEGMVRVALRETEAGPVQCHHLTEPGAAVRLNAGEVAWQYYRDRSCLLVIADTPYDPQNYVEANTPLSPADREALTAP
ncbi:MAG: WxcM-like domain-containing protein [Oceanicaulis sp.]